MKILSSALILLASTGLISGNLPKTEDTIPAETSRDFFRVQEEQHIEPVSSTINFYFFNGEELLGFIQGKSIEEVISDVSFEEYCNQADCVAISDSPLIREEVPYIHAEAEQSGTSAHLLLRAKAKNMSTHGKAFWWGYQVYFSHQTMMEISSYMDIGSAASGGIAALLGVASAGAGVAVGILSAFVFTNFQIMKKFDKGEGVTLTQEIWGPGIYWFNSGNCIQGE